MPVHLAPEVLNDVISSKSDWLKLQIKRAVAIKPEPEKKYVTGEIFLFKGEKYFLVVNHQGPRSTVFIGGDNRICMTVKADSDVSQRKKILNHWYRNELKYAIAKTIAKWQPVVGVTVNEFGVRKMRTRWGSCNIQAGRIWLNFALIKFAEPFLEYVIVHEMVHLLERHHNDRFKRFMDQFIPDWRGLKKDLDLFQL